MDAKPLILSEELAKWTRNANPADWLRDAHSEIVAWLPTMQEAKGANLRVRMTKMNDAPMLQLECGNGRPYGIDPCVGYFVLQSGGLKFWIEPRCAENLDLEQSIMTDEQQFVRHLLSTLKNLLSRAG